MTMIERVARAISHIEKGSEADWTYFITTARNAIAAMREPTDAMIEAGMDYDERELNASLGRAPTVEECQAGEWRAMIDAAMPHHPL